MDFEMFPVFVLHLVVLSLLLPLHSAEGGKGDGQSCWSLKCGKLEHVGFPITVKTRRDCGFFFLEGCSNKVQKIRLEEKGNLHEVEGIYWYGKLSVYDRQLGKLLRNRSCEAFNYFSLPSNSSSFSFIIDPKNIPHLFKCNRNSNIRTSECIKEVEKCDNFDFSIYHADSCHSLLFSDPECSLVELPAARDFQPSHDDLFTSFTPRFRIEIEDHSKCSSCVHQGQECKVDRSRNVTCVGRKEDKQLQLKLGIGLGLGIPATVLIGFIILYYSKLKSASSHFQPTNTNSDPSSTSDLEQGSICFGVPLFSYCELEEATNNFDTGRELGDGGFGTVYHGKLKDGREVAVKRLYEHNYKRVQQFINEVLILTRLRHQNLVSLYGCTSRQSRELLLVYEYIPNGTVADHLHGNQAKPGSLPWSIRMKIAIETASALVYLHASDIVHRDVKTNNILLDNNFCIKVADFGLSRLFPTDVTHVSTAPQGTPGYVDPEYHQCYQLTSKSDVYSFGVVLAELLSSMPAVDITRHRQEINLANLALNKIQRSAFAELVDPSLGFESDTEVRRMTISVAELAYQCLQQDKEMRPSMDEVLEALTEIQNGIYEPQKQCISHDHQDGLLSSTKPPPPPSPECDEVGLLKNIKLPPSPISVNSKWDSKSTTSNATVVSSYL